MLKILIIVLTLNNTLMKSRTKARSVALQVLYEVDMTGHLPGIVFTQRIEENPIGRQSGRLHFPNYFWGLSAI